MTCNSTTYAKCIIVFPQQQWLRKSDTLLPYTHIASFVPT